MFKNLLLASIVGLAAAECPNACSGHGTCSTFDMCSCYRNWEAADCSQRTCPFDLAHVDTPKGDLDMSNSITTGTVIGSSTVYPAGTQEMYPAMKDGAGAADSNTAHYYMECSNKGICDRKTGECECFDGYDGTACQRASCPNDCSGHGTCESIAELAFDDYENVYALWDADKTMGCSCDAGYDGADCSSRTCKVGVDPLYVDDTTARVTTTSVRISAGAADISGTYALKFFDYYGEDYITKAIKGESSYSTSCTDVKAALEALPDSVIGSVTCSPAAAHPTNGVEYTLTFLDNPGYLKPLEVVAFLDGSQTTLTGTSLTIDTFNQVTGEDTDYFATKCAGVVASIAVEATGTTWTANDATPASLAYIAGLSTAEEKLVKACLGDSDGDSSNNVEVYNWDKGVMTEYMGGGTGIATNNVIGSFPHAIKTVPVSQSSNYDVGEFHLVWFDDSISSKEFRVANLPATAGVGSYIYTTEGTVQMLGLDKTTGTTTDAFDSNKNETRVTGYFSQYSNKIYTSVDTSCETGDASSLMVCLEKGDKLFVVDGCYGEGVALSYFGGNVLGSKCADTTGAATNTGNLFTINKIYTKPHTSTTTGYLDTSASTSEKEDRYVIEVDSNLSWDGSAIENSGDVATSTTNANSGIVLLFKFTPASTGNYAYVGACSNRGSCDGESGLCACFKGYTGDDCSTQNALAV